MKSGLSHLVKFLHDQFLWCFHSLRDSSRQPSRWADLDASVAIRRINIIGFSILVLMFGGVGSWATFTEISGAVIAPGVVVVESAVKRVQHPTGGVVGEILVKEGDLVEEGQILMRLDDTVTRSTLAIVQSQLDELTSRQARLTAERDGAIEITFPDELLARSYEKTVMTAVAGEDKLFESRRTSRLGQRSQLRERVTQTKEEIIGLTSQQSGKGEELVHIGEELNAVRGLYEKNLVSIARIMALQRDRARIGGEHGQVTAEIARARGKISEIELQIIQLEQDFRTEVLKDLRESEGKIAELRERRTAAEDQLKRIEIRAPQSGTVYQLSVRTIGGVIGGGETLMQIVPLGDTLIVEAKVPPADIDQVSLGAPVHVRVRAGNQRTMPDLVGNVIYVAPDLAHENKDLAASRSGQPRQQEEAWFVVRIALAKGEVERLKDLRLSPGMPAEAYIQTSMRTPLQYLIKPLRDQIAHTFRER